MGEGNPDNGLSLETYRRSKYDPDTYSFVVTVASTFQLYRGSVKRRPSNSASDAERWLASAEGQSAAGRRRDLAVIALLEAITGSPIKP